MSALRISTELDIAMLRRMIDEGWAMSELEPTTANTFVLQNLDGHQRFWFDGSAFPERLRKIGSLQHGGLPKARSFTQ